MSFEFDERDADINSFVFQALGAASMCWNPRPSEQVFDSTTAKEIGDALLVKINEYVKSKIEEHDATMAEL